MSLTFAENKKKEFIYELVVTQGDITPYRSASFINHIRWHNIARDSLLLWRNLGFDESLRNIIETELSFCKIQYKREAMLQDEIIIKVNSSGVKDYEFTLLFKVIRKDNAMLINLGKQKINFRNSKTGDIFRLPCSLVDNILKPIEVDEKSLLFK